MSWQTMMTVVPFSCSRRMMLMTSTHSRKSRPVVGSSSTTTGGASTTIDASANNCRVPRFNRNGSSSGSKPNSSIISSTRRSAASSSAPSALKPKSSSSRTVDEQIWLSGFWNRKPTLRAISLVLSCVVDTPSMSTSPDSGFNRPFTRRIVVDLPAPFVPTNATNSPSRTMNDTPFKMGIDASYDAQTSRNSIMRPPPE